MFGASARDANVTPRMGRWCTFPGRWVGLTLIHYRDKERTEMSKRGWNGFRAVMTLLLTFAAPLAAHADPLSYGYVALDQVPLPAPYTFFAPASVVGGRVYGTVFDDTFTIINVAVYSNGAITVGPSGVVTVANARGDMGGQLGFTQAALFHGDVTTPVPALPGQVSSTVTSLADNDVALIESTDASFNFTWAYLRQGTLSVIDFGLPDPAFGASMNNNGLIGVTKEESPADHFLHGYRFDPRTGVSTLLPPSPDPTDIHVLIQGINAGGDVLGYSFADPQNLAAYHERVGIWGANNVFQTYFFETINTQELFFNDRDEIVITESSDGESYLVPSPGTRLDLASITSNVPDGVTLSQVVGIDNAGNIAGFSFDEFGDAFPFLLTPMGNGPTPPQAHVSHGMPAWVAHTGDKSHGHK